MHGYRVAAVRRLGSGVVVAVMTLEQAIRNAARDAIHQRVTPVELRTTWLAQWVDLWGCDDLIDGVERWPDMVVHEVLRLRRRANWGTAWEAE